MADSKLTACKHCGATIAKSAKTCPHCGGKNKSSSWPWILLLLVGLLMVFIIVISGEYLMNSSDDIDLNDLTDDSELMTEEEYKAACSELTYEDLARNAESLVGEKVVFTGQIQQVVFEGENLDSEYRVGVTENEYGWYEPDEVVYLYYGLGGGSRILLDDIVTFYGEVLGFEEYTSTAGIAVKIPAVRAAYLTLNE